MHGNIILECTVMVPSFQQLIKGTNIPRPSPSFPLLSFCLITRDLLSLILHSWWLLKLTKNLVTSPPKIETRSILRSTMHPFLLTVQSKYLETTLPWLHCAHVCICLLACSWPYTINFKWACLNFNIKKIELMHLGEAWRAIARMAASVTWSWDDWSWSTCGQPAVDDL